MDTSEFIGKLSTLLRDHGFTWVDESVQEAITEGADVERKEATQVRLRKDFKEADDLPKKFADINNYIDAFEPKPGRTNATVTREYTIDEIAELYLTAIYSAFVEPSQLSAVGLTLFGHDVESVVFADEDGSNLFDIRQLQEGSEALVELEILLKEFVSHGA